MFLVPPQCRITKRKVEILTFRLKKNHLCCSKLFTSNNDSQRSDPTTNIQSWMNLQDPVTSPQFEESVGLGDFQPSKKLQTMDSAKDSSLN